MSAVLTYEAQLSAAIAAAESRLSQGPEWLAALRTRALAIHKDLGIPTPKHEEWKYTPLRTVANTNWQPAEGGPALFEREFRTYTDSKIKIVLVNGRLDRNLSDIPATLGLTAMSLFDAIGSEPTISEFLGQVASVEEHTFAALNTALFEDGLYLHLKKGAMVEPVIEILHITSGSGQVIAPRILVVAEEGSVAQILEQYVSAEEAANLTIPVTEVVTHKHANIEHVRLQDESTENFHIALWETRQTGESEYRSYNVAFGAAIGRLDQNIMLDGRHITTRLDGVVVARGEQILDNHTKLDHAMPDCNSFEIYKQIIDDKASVVFNGKIFVHQDAQKTDAKQTNQALLLSPNATINSKPQLEIFADDVKCTHGATVGQIEPTFLFYMRSRGIPKAEAEAILVYAFAAEVLELISNDDLKKNLEARLFEKLGLS